MGGEKTGYNCFIPHPPLLQTKFSKKKKKKKKKEEEEEAKIMDNKYRTRNRVGIHAFCTEHLPENMSSACRVLGTKKYCLFPPVHTLFVGGQQFFLFLFGLKEGPSWPGSQWERIAGIKISLQNIY